MEPRRMYASERDGLFKLAMALEFVVRGRDSLKARLKMIPGGARDMAMIDKKLTTLLNALLDTAPEDHRRSLRRNLDGVSYTIGAAMPGTQTHNDDFGVWLSYSTLNTMITALEDHCLMCGKDGAEQRKCPLQNALDECCTNVKDAPGGGCKYRGCF